MKKLLVILAFTAITILFSGCATTKISMNEYRSAARSLGDVSATVAIETKKADQAKINEAIVKIQDFLNKVDPSTLTKDELQTKLEDLAKNEKLQELAAKIITIIPNDLPIENVKRIVNEFVDGLKTGSDKWNPGDSN